MVGQRTDVRRFQRAYRQRMRCKATLGAAPRGQWLFEANDHTAEIKRNFEPDLGSFKPQLNTVLVTQAPYLEAAAGTARFTRNVLGSRDESGFAATGLAPCLLSAHSRRPI